MTFTLFNKSIKICEKVILSRQYNTYSIIYDDSINNYTLVNITNFENYEQCQDILILEEPIINNIKEVTDKSKEEIFSNIDNILEDKELGVTYEIEGEDFSIIIRPTNATPLPNTTHVDFDECEKKIREKKGISDSSIITFLQIEVDNKDEKSLYNQIKYFVYDEKMEELDLSLCEELETQIHYAIKEDSNLDISSISNFQQIGIDILNIRDTFFNDLCYSYSDSNNDMILEDRIKYLYQNYSLCEEGCTYNSIDLENMNLACNCKIQRNNNESNLNMTPLIYEQPSDTSFFDSNIGVVKCYKLVFSMNNKLSNIGFIIFSILFLFYFIFMVCFCKNGIKPVKEYLSKEMEQKGYTNNQNINQSEYKGRNKLKSNNTSKKNKKGKRSGIISNPHKKKKGKGNSKKIKINKIENNNQIILTGFNKNNDKDKEKSNSNSIIKSKSRKKKKNKKIIKKVGGIIESDDTNNFGIVRINLNNYKDYFPKSSDQSFHNYTLDEANRYDRRNIIRVAYIYLLSRQIIFRTFFQKSPLELFPLRFILFIFMLSCDLALNALFYFNDNISKKYQYAKNIFLLAFSSNITIIIYSTLLSYFLITLLSKLSNSSNAIRNVFREVEEKIKNNKKFIINDELKREVYLKIEKILKYLKIKITFLLIIETILILFFWYFVTAFCHVFASTQTSWLLDSFLSILSRFIIELIFSFIFAKLYQMAVHSGFKTFYKILMCIYDF